jgi:hypothetical protein
VSEWSVRRIHAIRALTGAARYLEVGVYGGGTFLHVQLPSKDAVDPAFQFDTKGFASEQVRFFQMPSDEFFASRHAKPQYDVIFLDGLHTFEQTFRDFLATLPLSHDRTVWLIDDTLPSDAYSALPDQAHSYRERQKAGIPGNPWHGDVYKVICAIHDFCPNLDFATIVDHGNPQTLVWRQPREAFKPVFRNLEDISRLSYFDIEKNESAMRFSTEEQAMARVADALLGRTGALDSKLF